MDMNKFTLSDEDFDHFKGQLSHHLRNLHKRFGDEVLQDPLFKAISYQENDELRLREPDTTADILNLVQKIMGLAVRDPSCNNAIDVELQGVIDERTGYQPDTAPDPIYSALKILNGDSIRLINIAPGQPDDPVVVELFAVNAIADQPYEALSYVWGTREFDESILVNGDPFKVAINLAEALRCLRPSDDEPGRTLWVDALCINQNDDNERASQVSLMGEIYRSAADVLIFLGAESDDSSMIMEYLGIDDSEVQASILEEENDGWGDRDARVINELVKRCEFNSAQFLQAADAFFKRPWWSRVWIVQEFALSSKEPQWYCGRTSTSTVHMRERLGKLYSYLIREAGPLKGNPDLISNPKVDIVNGWVNMAQRRWNINMLLKLTRHTRGQYMRPRQFMIRMVYRESTDPRDRLFSIREMLDPISKQIFAPDYTLSANNLFLKLSSYLLLHDLDGHMYDLYQLSRSPNLPSWALDFTTPILVHGVAHLSPYLKEAPWAKVSGSSIFNRILSVSGFEIDILETIYNVEDDEDDMQILGRFWKFEGHVQKGQPAKILPQDAIPFLPDVCIVPFHDLRKDLVKARSAMQTHFPTTADIPGYIRITHEGLMLINSLVPISNPTNLTCDNWKIVASKPIYDKFRIIAGKVVTACAQPLIPESFLGGASFDLPNLERQITSIEFPQHDGRDQIDNNSPTGNSRPDNSQTPLSSAAYCPQYTYLKDIMLEAANAEELQVLKDMTTGLAKAFSQTFEESSGRMLGTPTSGQVAKVLADSNGYSHLSNPAAYQKLYDECQCVEKDRTIHRNILTALLNSAEKSKPLQGPVLSPFKNMNMEGYDPNSAIDMTMKRQYTAMFMTQLGFIGASFQKGPSFKKGDKLVVLDGIPAPMVIEETGDGMTQRMKSAVHVVGLEKVDIAKLAELGIFKKRIFKIV